MARYHVRADGSMGVCHAEEGNCPFGGEEGTRHFDSESEARAYSEQVVKNNTTDKGGLRKNPPVEEPQEDVYEGYDTQEMMRGIEDLDDFQDNDFKQFKRSMQGAWGYIPDDQVDGEQHISYLEGKLDELEGLQSALEYTGEALDGFDEEPEPENETLFYSTAMAAIRNKGEMSDELDQMHQDIEDEIDNLKDWDY